jgi:hypothetical protein
MQTAQLVSFWEGPVTWVERLCTASMRHVGHPLTIYTYHPEQLAKCDLPADIRNAREVITEDHPAARYHAAGRFTLFSNLFRLELQCQERGIWVDLDCYMIRPLVPKFDYVFGFASKAKLNGAVLGLPPNCPMTDDYMKAITADPLHIPWASFKRRIRREVEILFGQSQPSVSVRTNIGPRALTYFAKKHDLLKYAMPQEAFYAVLNKDTGLLTHHDHRMIESKMTAETVIVHLWRGKMRRLGLLQELPPASSYLGKACNALGIGKP